MVTCRLVHSLCFQQGLARALMLIGAAMSHPRKSSQYPNHKIRSGIARGTSSNLLTSAGVAAACSCRNFSSRHEPWLGLRYLQGHTRGMLNSCRGCSPLGLLHLLQQEPSLPLLVMQQPAPAETSWQPSTLAWRPFCPSAPEASPAPSPPAPVEASLQLSRTPSDESPLKLPSGHFVPLACGVCANLTHGRGI